MKPRRENGATFVSPMKSGVCRGSALMEGFPRDLLECAFSRQSNTNHQPARIFGISAGEIFGLIRPVKKTRPPAEYDACAALPCPDIEIGLRRPVNYRMHGWGAGLCDPSHNWRKKLRPASWRQGPGRDCSWHRGFPRPGRCQCRDLAGL